MKQWLLIGVLALVVGLPAARANVYSFNYASTNGIQTVLGSGTFTTQDAPLDPGGTSYLVTGITGTADGYAIAGLTAPGAGGFAYNQIFYSAGPQPFDLSGLLFNVDSAPPSYSPINFYSINGQLFEVNYANGFPTYTGAQLELPGVPISFTATLDNRVNETLTPEPGFYGVLALGLGGLFVSVRRRRRA